MTPQTAALQAPLFMRILQARIMERVTILFSRGSPHLGIEPEFPALAGSFLITEPLGKSCRSMIYLEEMGLISLRSEVKGFEATELRAFMF